MTWLRIESEPVRQLVKDVADLAHITAGESRAMILESVGRLASSVDGETPNISATLRNRSGESSRLFSSPPLGAVAKLVDTSGTVFEGLVYRVELGETCSITVEA